MEPTNTKQTNHCAIIILSILGISPVSKPYKNEIVNQSNSNITTSTSPLILTLQSNLFINNKLKLAVFYLFQQKFNDIMNTPGFCLQYCYRNSSYSQLPTLQQPFNKAISIFRLVKCPLLSHHGFPYLFLPLCSVLGC